MSRFVTLALAALTLTLASGCDEIVQRAAAARGPSALAQEGAPADGNEGECGACAKFRTRPPSGINVPPSL
ncbi:MAG TPA: hypothetical protein VIK91_13430 [Nannocystis sp.]